VSKPVIGESHTADERRKKNVGDAEQGEPRSGQPRTLQPVDRTKYEAELGQEESALDSPPGYCRTTAPETSRQLRRSTR